GERISCRSRWGSTGLDCALPSVFPRLSRANRSTRPRPIFVSQFDSASRGPARNARSPYPLLPSRLAGLWERDRDHIGRYLDPVGCTRVPRFEAVVAAAAAVVSG